ncbi:MAG: hypothetical protein GY726_05855, partial [Proteobacteria bacterium]|nr:hypothetical protein [Pseudomonadota bacterium]
MYKPFKRSTLAALCLLGSTAITTTTIAQEITLDNHDDKQSYALGMVFGQQIAGSLAQANAEINHDILL